MGMVVLAACVFHSFLVYFCCAVLSIYFLRKYSHMEKLLADPLISFIVFGWPLIVLSITVSIFGIVDERAWLVFLGALMAVPFAYNLNYSAPGYYGIPLLLPLLQVGSAFAVREDHPVWAWILLAPTITVVAWLFVFVSIVGYF